MAIIAKEVPQDCLYKDNSNFQIYMNVIKTHPRLIDEANRNDGRIYPIWFLGF